MARINREILVPYLQDICALELAKKKLQDREETLRAAADNARRSVENQPDPERYWQDYNGSFLKTVAGLGVNSVFLSFLVGFFHEEVAQMMLIYGAIAAVAAFSLRLIFAILVSIFEFSVNQRNRHRWRKQRKVLRKDKKKSEKTMNLEIPGLQREISGIDGLLARAYSANLIPSRYRDLYAAVYLYDWFSTSMADDMDMALNTYVLEQIKSRLDTIIQNQTQQIINQRRIMAQQAAMNRTIEREAERMRDSVAQMNESLEKQNMYLSMIDSNVAATRYFAEETYKKWY